MEELIIAAVSVIQSVTVGNLKIKEPEKFVETVVKRLSDFGYSATDNDKWLIAFCVQKVAEHITNTCNTPLIPDGLFFTAADRVCGEFLYSKNQTGTLEIETLDLGGIVTQIHEGDTTIQFANGASDQEKFNLLVNSLISKGEGDLVCYRKIKW